VGAHQHCDLRVRLTPRADRDAVTAVADGVVHVRVTAPPADGRANESLRRLLAKQLRVPRSTVELVRGHTAREKTVRVAGLEAAEAHRILERDLRD
jgi:uncharacterized protein (TIGR00251 family)